MARSAQHLSDFPYEVAVAAGLHDRGNHSVDTIEEWLYANVGEYDVAWAHWITASHLIITFRDPEMATFFALRWAHLPDSGEFLFDLTPQ